MKKSILILGGDKRIEYLYDFLYNDGFNVEGMLNGLNRSLDYKVLRSADILILGMPVSRDKVSVYAPSCPETTAYLKEIVSNFGGTKILGGVLPEAVFENAGKETLCIDYSELEDLMMLNAISTAEGAIEVVMKNTDFTICSSNVIIIGNGRIGKVLAKMLSGLGARVTVTARSEKDFAYIEAMGYDFCHNENISQIIPMADVIINTVPHTLLSFADYKLIKKDAFAIDLASMPGYIDKDLCKANSIKFEHALSLPGRAAPKSAAYAIYRAILSHLK